MFHPLLTSGTDRCHDRAQDRTSAAVGQPTPPGLVPDARRAPGTRATGSLLLIERRETCRCLRRKGRRKAGALSATSRACFKNNRDEKLIRWFAVVLSVLNRRDEIPDAFDVHFSVAEKAASVVTRSLSDLRMYVPATVNMFQRRRGAVGLVTIFQP